MLAPPVDTFGVSPILAAHAGPPRFPLVLLRFLLLLLPCVLLTACAGTPEPYVYRYVPGRTATLGENGVAVAPAEAPDAVRAAIAAGNRIVGLPYVRGGGHRSAETVANGYDCSGATSYVLAAAGALNGGTMPSEGFRRYGARGPGEWVSVYARRGHVFLVVAGLRFDTGWTRQPRGPHWTTRLRTAEGCTLRHPPGM